MPNKTFTAGPLSSADVNTYLMQQAVITCTSGTRPASPVNGMTVYETDTDCYATYDGATWVYAIGGPSSSYTPTAGGLTVGNGSLSGRYQMIGKRVEGRIRFLSGSTTSFSGTLTFSLPVAAAASHAGADMMGYGHCHNGSTASRANIVAHYSTSTTVGFQGDGFVANATAPFTWGTSANIYIALAYEAA